MKSFNVVIATTGRPTLQKMIDSIAPQLQEQDYITIIWDSQPVAVQVNSSCQVIQIQNEKPLGSWGHGSRTRWQDSLPGDYLMNADDDDIYTEDAMTHIREHCIEDKLYVFQMAVDLHVCPRYHKIEMANIGTPCGVYKPGGLPSWDPVYGGDFMFYDKLSKIKEVEFIDKVIYKVRG